MHMCVCMYYIYVHFFAVSVACTLEQVFWAPVHLQLYALCRCSFDIDVHICDTVTFAAGCAHMCICILMCTCMHVYMEAYVRLRYCLTRWGIVAEISCLCIDERGHVCAYVCACMRVYEHAHIYMNMHIWVSIYTYAYTCICTRVWVYICTRVGAFCLFVLSNPSTTCVCITGIFHHLLACVNVDWKRGFFPACSWLALIAGVGGYVLTRVEIGVLSYIFLSFCGC